MCSKNAWIRRYFVRIIMKEREAKERKEILRRFEFGV